LVGRIDPHLGKMPSFGKILNLKISHLKKNFDEYFCLISAIIIRGLHSKVTKLYVFHKRKFPKFMSETQVSYVHEAPVPYK
jgi:hypothetical protein